MGDCLEVQASIASRRIHDDQEPSLFEVFKHLFEPVAAASAIRLLMDLIEGITNQNQIKLSSLGRRYVVGQILPRGKNFTVGPKFQASPMKIFHHRETFARIIPSLEGHWVGQSPFSKKKREANPLAPLPDPRSRIRSGPLRGAFQFLKK